MNLLKYLSIIFIACSVSTFGQSYSGPAAGNVSSGVMVSTDNFTSSAVGNELPGPLIAREQMDYFQEPYIYPDGIEIFDNYTYIEDGNAHLQSGSEIGTSFELNSFASIPMTNAVPPDPHMAVGPNHVLSMVNGRFHIYDRQGNLLKNISDGAWVGQVINHPVVSDPQVIYDHYEGRWVMVWLTINSPSFQSSITVCYSDDDNPIGTWFMYASNGSVNGTTNSNAFGDYPQVGYDDLGIYISTREFLFAGPTFAGAKIRILNKSELYAANGGPLTFTDLWSIRLLSGQQTDDLHPTISYDAGNNTAYFVIVPNFGNFYSLYKITNPITNPVLSGVVLGVPFFGVGPDAQQLGGGLPLSAGANGSGMRNSPIIRDDSLYAVHHIQNSQFPTSTSVKHFVIDITTNSIVRQVEFGAQGFYYIYPTIAVDQDHNIAITYTRSGLTEYAGSYYSTRLATDPQGFSPSKVMTEGKGNYVNAPGGGANRWGDYLGAALDPVNQYNIWLYSEYAAATNQWGTWLTEIRMKLYPGAHAYPFPNSIDFKEVETGTKSQNASVIIANYGDADLVVSNIPSTFGDFNLESNITFPLTLASYDSVTIEFSYSPTTEGAANVVYPVTSNDPLFTGVNLSGYGYDVVLASEKTFYASSGTQNNGNLVTIDPLTGSGTNIGASLFNEVTSIAISPVDGKIYGMISGSSSADIVKINSAAGDAHLYFNIAIPLVAAIAFDSSGVLYCVTRSGEIHTIDLDDGTTNFVVDAVGTYLAITFHPQSNELWATSRAIPLPNRDAIFKVNFTTGDTLIVGHTGLGKQTNGIVFDENLNLFGLIGTSAEQSEFVSINTSTGSGTVIGGTGFNHLISLAYVETVVSSADDDNNSHLFPTEYVLRQNYPNPFNPTTKIEFSLPVASEVKLTIYNLLGQELVRLIEGERNAGTHSVQWNAADANGQKISSGIYFYELKASGINGNNFQQIKKMILLK